MEYNNQIENLRFPLAIKVNAWFTLAYPLMQLFIMSPEKTPKSKEFFIPKTVK